MWPRKLDLNQDECNSMLRQIELDCYSSVITAFRAQGGLDDLKTRILADLRKIFHIDEDRHKAEARRVANDEELTTIADLVFGESASSEWRNEGRRTNGLLQRAPAQTAFCKMSNNIKEDATNMNSLLPYPSDTRVSLEQREFDSRRPVDQKPIVTEDMVAPPPMKNILLPLDEKRYLKRCSEFDKLFRDTRQVLKKQEEAGNEITTPPPKRPKTKTPRATKKMKSPTPMNPTTPTPLILSPPSIEDGSPPLEKVVKKPAATSAKKTKPTKRAAKTNNNSSNKQQPVIPPIITATTEFDAILKNTDTVIMPPPPTPPPLLTPQPPPLMFKKEISRNYAKLLPASSTISATTTTTSSPLKPLTIQPIIPSVQKFTANPIHSPPTVINLGSPNPKSVTPNIIQEPKVLPILPGTSFAQTNAKIKNPVILNNYKFTSAPTSALSAVDRGKIKLFSSGNGKLCIRLPDAPQQKSTTSTTVSAKPKINIQKVQILQPAHKSPVVMGKPPIFAAGNKPISIVKGPKFITSNIKHGNNSSTTNSNVIVLGSLASPPTSRVGTTTSGSTIDNIINEDTPVDILSAPIEIADGDDGDSLNNHTSGIVGVTDWEMELDKNKNVEVSEVYSVDGAENNEIVEYEGDESFSDVIVEEQEEEEEETIIVDDGEKESDSNKTLEGFVTTLQQKPLDIISSNNSQFKQPAIVKESEKVEGAKNHKFAEVTQTIQEISKALTPTSISTTTNTKSLKPGTEERKESPQDEPKMIVYSVSEKNPEDMASIPSQEESKMPDEHGLLPQKDGECVN